MPVLQTEYEFTLPRGYVDDAGNLHKTGTMRLATAADEILPLQDPRVQRNPAYLSLILLSRVVLRIGGAERATCPHCERDFDLEPDRLGGSPAIPSPG